MNDRLTRKNVERMVRDCVAAFHRDECRTCDCFQGFLTQLEIDAAEDVSGIVCPHKVAKEQMHACLGCDPCPPGAAFADYLRKQQECRPSSQVSETGSACGGPRTFNAVVRTREKRIEQKVAKAAKKRKTGRI